VRHGKGTRVRSAGGDEKAASFCQKSRKSRFVRRATTRGEKHERTRRGGSPWGTVGRSARCAPRRRRSRRLVRPRHVAYLHDSRAVVRNGGDALVVVHELVQASRALRDRTGVVSGNTKSKGRGRETTCGSANREATRGRTRVVRTESTTAMHALMLEISWPLPWLVSVPSRRSTIWGCCGGRGGGVSLGRHRSRRRKQKRSGSSRPGARSNAGRDRVFPRRNARRGGRSHRTYDHLPVGHLHEARHGARL
jgi:hypothetical protein